MLSAPGTQHLTWEYVWGGWVLKLGPATRLPAEPAVTGKQQLELCSAGAEVRVTSAVPEMTEAVHSWACALHGGLADFPAPLLEMFDCIKAIKGFDCFEFDCIKHLPKELHE